MNSLLPRLSVGLDKGPQIVFADAYQAVYPHVREHPAGNPAPHLPFAHFQDLGRLGNPVKFGHFLVVRFHRAQFFASLLPIESSPG